MARLLNLPAITTAITLTTSPVFATGGNAVGGLTLQANFVYGSGSASIDCWIQTSADKQAWCDIANFHFATTSGIALFNLTSLTPVTSQYTPTDATLTANTAVDGILGNWFRCKYSSSGTYSATSLMIDAVSSSRLEPW